MENMDLHRIVQLAQLDLLLELKRICECHKISYILVGGSLIGAIRHKGFIPWDDDIDIGMLREDYDRFINICESELSKEYILLDGKSDPKSPHAFAKLKIKGTKYVEFEAKDTGMDSSIFIDIFPYENVPPKRIQRVKQKYKVLFLKKILQLKLGWNLSDGKGVGKKILYKIFIFISSFKSLQSWKHALENEILRYKNVQSEYAVSLNGAYGYERETIEKKLFRDTMLVDFEEYKISVPKDYNRYLTKIYGDYMQLPPENMRGSKHRVIEINLGNYKIKNGMGGKSNG